MLRMRLSLTGFNTLTKHSILKSNLILTRLLYYGKETPSPPKLSKEEQEEFERLQKIANAEDTIREYNNSILNGSNNSMDENTGTTGAGNKESLDSLRMTLKDKNDIGRISPEYTKTIPEFEGDKNPKTGEIGGPKQDPLRHGDWSFNGRVTDF